MRKVFILCCLLLAFFTPTKAQEYLLHPTEAANRWADSVLATLSPEQKIAQLMVLRLSVVDAKTKKPVYFDSAIHVLIKKYGIGGVCVFQGHPVKLATILNQLQAASSLPLLNSIDAEWGVGMRLYDSVRSLPRQMMLGAIQDSSILYEYGKIVGAQCKRLGIQVNFAPVVDINNNPLNPVINERSFGEDKFKVAQYAIQYMKGMQDMGVMACAKHFPGHGDVAVDSHYDLPVILKSMEALNDLELYPFKEIFAAGIGSVMIAHLFIPAIDNTPNRATSISDAAIHQLLRRQMGYYGLTFTDALEMQGVKKYFPNGEASLQSIMAGNDMLCLPENVEDAIKKIKTAVKKKKISWDEIEYHTKRVLLAKYAYTGVNPSPINTENITADLNQSIEPMRKKIAQNALTLLAKPNNSAFPLKAKDSGKVAYVGIGLSADNVLATELRNQYGAAVFYFNYKLDASRILSTVALIKEKYTHVIIGVHAYSRVPANNFGLSNPSIQLINQLAAIPNSLVLAFGNPYAIKNFCNAPHLVACYDDDVITQQTALEYLQGQWLAKGVLPVTVCEKFPYGSGILLQPSTTLEYADAVAAQLNTSILSAIDTVANEAIAAQATPGCVVLVARNGKIAYQKAYGHFSYDAASPLPTDAVFDLASITKIGATTLGIMKLYDEGKIALEDSVGKFIPESQGSPVAAFTIKNLLLHQAGFSPFIKFYETMMNKKGLPDKKYFATTPKAGYSIKVADQLYFNEKYKDTLYAMIYRSAVQQNPKYVYSDNDFIVLGQIIEKITGKTLDAYLTETFYQPLGLTACFNPIGKIKLDLIAPTEAEVNFRHQLLRGYVHDPGAALFGGVSGHAGLFSNAYDLAVIMQLLMNEGVYGGKNYLKASTIQLFTAYQSSLSRRGLGFDKPEKDNATRKEPYPCMWASELTFGHTGFTGTCTWADPQSGIVYVFLSNRVSPNGGDNKKLLQLNVRSRIQDIIYKARL
ncbi:MAG: glycoside hydrolase family 3 N-terminal domain-containing protein [Ferruginibacter sp.]